MRLLLAEDDPVLASGLKSALNQEGYQVTHFSDGRHAQLALDQETFDLVVLDLGLPGRDGCDILAHLRNRQVLVPVLVLTARDEVEERVRCLDLGADDYLIKPFDLGELLARLRALRRRYAGRTELAIHYRDLCLDPSARRVTRAGVEVALSTREFELLEVLLENVGRVLSRERLDQVLYGWGDGVESNAMEVHIHKLRKKLGHALIQTVRGVGYRVPEPPPE